MSCPCRQCEKRRSFNHARMNTHMRQGAVHSLMRATVASLPSRKNGRVSKLTSGRYRTSRGIAKASGRCQGASRLCSRNRRRLTPGRRAPSRLPRIQGWPPAGPLSPRQSTGLCCRAIRYSMPLRKKKLIIGKQTEQGITPQCEFPDMSAALKTAGGPFLYGRTPNLIMVTTSSREAATCTGSTP